MNQQSLAHYAALHRCGFELIPHDPHSHRRVAHKFQGIKCAEMRSYDQLFIRALRPSPELAKELTEVLRRHCKARVIYDPDFGACFIIGQRDARCGERGLSVEETQVGPQRKQHVGREWVYVHHCTITNGQKVRTLGFKF